MKDPILTLLQLTNSKTIDSGPSTVAMISQVEKKVCGRRNRLNVGYELFVCDHTKSNLKITLWDSHKRCSLDAGCLKVGDVVFFHKMILRRHKALELQSGYDSSVHIVYRDGQFIPQDYVTYTSISSLIEWMKKESLICTTSRVIHQRLAQVHDGSFAHVRVLLDRYIGPQLPTDPTTTELQHKIIIYDEYNMQIGLLLRNEFAQAAFISTLLFGEAVYEITHLKFYLHKSVLQAETTAITHFRRVGFDEAVDIRSRLNGEMLQLSSDNFSQLKTIRRSCSIQVHGVRIVKISFPKQAQKAESLIEQYCCGCDRVNCISCGHELEYRYKPLHLQLKDVNEDTITVQLTNSSLTRLFADISASTIIQPHTSEPHLKSTVEELVWTLTKCNKMGEFFDCKLQYNVEETPSQDILDIEPTFSLIQLYQKFHV